MTDLSALLADLTCGDDGRAEIAALELAKHGEAAFTALRELSRSDRPDVRWWAVRALAQLPGPEGLVDELAAALEDESAEVRQCAAMALSLHPHPRALPPLARALSDPNGMTARLACNALIRIGAEAVPALIEVLQAGERPARLQATRALAEIKDPRAIPVLMKVLGEDSVIMQYWAERGLDKLGLGMIYMKPE